MGSAFSIQTPTDYHFPRDVCSYGYFLLAPNQWDPARAALGRPLNLEGGVATLVIHQPEGVGAELRVRSDRTLSRRERAQATAQIARMLRLDDGGVAEFHRVDPRWKAAGRGRLFRSPTFFEDVVKTVTSCNVTWPSTVAMNRRLCEVINPAFPTPAQLARRRPATLRARCGVGYRDARLVALAKLFASGAIDPDWYEDASTPDDGVYEALLELPGIGPYAAGNIMQLLGRYSRLAIDSESYRHARVVLGMEGTERALARRIEAHFAPFGEHRFRSYWFELLEYYERKKGPSWTWEPRTVATAFTALTRTSDAEIARRIRRGFGSRFPCSASSTIVSISRSTSK